MKINKIYYNWFPYDSYIWCRDNNIIKDLRKINGYFIFVDTSTLDAQGGIAISNNTNIYNYSALITSNKILLPNPKMYISPYSIKYRDLVTIPELSPAVVIEYYDNIGVFRDDLLYGGTKQRVIYEYLQFMDYKRYECVIYCGPPEGVMQVALGVVAKYINMPVYMLYTGDHDYTHYPLSMKAHKLGVNLVQLQKSLKEAQIYAKEFSYEKHGLLLPFGLNDQNFKNILCKALKLAIPASIRNKEIVLWTVVGSGLLLNVFYNVFPLAYIIGVEVGIKTNAHNINPSRTFIIRAPYKFGEKTIYPPPYPTVNTYDGKIWEQLKYIDIFQFKTPRKHYVWNVANELI